MSITIDTTAGGTTSNSFATLAEAEALVLTFTALVGLGVNTSGWASLGSGSDEIKKAAMVEAALSICSAPFVGRKRSESQALVYPMTMLDKYVPDQLVLETLKKAQVAEACALLVGRSASGVAVDEGVIQQRIGDRETTYSASRTRSTTYSSAADSILRRAGLIRGAFSSVYQPRR